MDKNINTITITLDGEDFYNIPEPITDDELNNTENN